MSTVGESWTEVRLLDHRRGPTLLAAAERLAGRVAIVTGASTGIGAAVTHLFLEWARVGGGDGAGRGPAGADGGGGPGDGSAVVGDVAVEPDVERLVATALDRHGRLDIVVSNAGIAARRRSSRPASMRGRDRHHLDGSFLVCRTAARAMVQVASPGAVVASTKSVAEP